MRCYEQGHFDHAGPQREEARRSVSGDAKQRPHVVRADEGVALARELLPERLDRHAGRSRGGEGSAGGGERSAGGGERSAGGGERSGVLRLRRHFGARTGGKQPHMSVRRDPSILLHGAFFGPSRHRQTILRVELASF